MSNKKSCQPKQVDKENLQIELDNLELRFRQEKARLVSKALACGYCRGNMFYASLDCTKVVVDWNISLNLFSGAWSDSKLEVCGFSWRTLESHLKAYYHE